LISGLEPMQRAAPARSPKFHREPLIGASKVRIFCAMDGAARQD
jgi:hypothetical protein